MSDSATDLLEFIDRSPSPYHAVAESVRRLEAAGFRAASETDVWELAPGDRLYVVRSEGSLAALQVGEVTPTEAGFRIIGAHTVTERVDLNEFRKACRVAAALAVVSE